MDSNGCLGPLAKLCRVSDLKAGTIFRKPCQRAICDFFYIKRAQPNETPIVGVCSFGRRILWQFVGPQDATTTYIFESLTLQLCLHQLVFNFFQVEKEIRSSDLRVTSSRDSSNSCHEQTQIRKSQLFPYFIGLP